jgi:hypothetical protein
MLTYREPVTDRQVTLDQYMSLTEGAEVQFEVILAPQNGDDLLRVLLKCAGKGQELPADLARIMLGQVT